MYEFNERDKGPLSDAKHSLSRLLMAQRLKTRKCLCFHYINLYVKYKISRAWHILANQKTRNLVPLV